MAESIKGNVSSTGLDKKASDRGVLDQTRPAGIMATGRKDQKRDIPRDKSERR